MSSLEQRRAEIVEIIRKRSNRWVSDEMATAMAEDILESGASDQGSLHDVRLAYERAYAREIKTLQQERDEARTQLAADRHKRKIILLERGVIGTGLSFVFGDLNKRSGVTSLFFIMTVVLLVLRMFGK